MSEQIKTEEWIQGLPLIPALGFVFGFSYESGYFYSLGIDMSLVLGLTDIVKSSVFSIMPTILIYIVWSLFDPAIYSKLDRKDPEKSLDTVTRVLMYSTMTMGALFYILLGAVPEFGFFAVMILTCFWVLPLLVQPIGHYFGLVVALPLFIFLFLVASFAILGFNSTDKIRSGLRSDFPRLQSFPDNTYLGDQKFHVVRHLSTGLLVGTESRENLWLVSGDGSQIIEFSIDYEPFKGVLCYTLDWCWASGWNWEQKSDSQRYWPE